MLEFNQVYNMDCLEGLKQLDSGSIHCCVTSPPYWALRNYGVSGQIGQENTPAEYVERLCTVFANGIYAVVYTCSAAGRRVLAEHFRYLLWYRQQRRLLRSEKPERTHRSEKGEKQSYSRIETERPLRHSVVGRLRSAGYGLVSAAGGHMEQNQLYALKRHRPMREISRIGLFICQKPAILFRL